MKNHKVTCPHCGERLDCDDACKADPIKPVYQECKGGKFRVDDQSLEKLHLMPTAPPVDDDEAWGEVADKHRIWCELVLTRNGKWDTYQAGMENAHQDLVNTGLADDMLYERDPYLWNGCWEGTVLCQIKRAIEKIALLGIDAKSFSSKECMAFLVAAVWHFDFVLRIDDPFDGNPTHLTIFDVQALERIWDLYFMLLPAEVKVSIPKGIIPIRLPEGIETIYVPDGVVLRLVGKQYQQ